MRSNAIVSQVHLSDVCDAGTPRRRLASLYLQGHWKRQQARVCMGAGDQHVHTQALHTQAGKNGPSCRAWRMACSPVSWPSPTHVRMRHHPHYRQHMLAAHPPALGHGPAARAGTPAHPRPADSACWPSSNRACERRPGRPASNLQRVATAGACGQHMLPPPSCRTCAAISCRASSSCDPLSHSWLPNVSPSMLSECTRTRTWPPCAALPATSAKCSVPSSTERYACAVK